MNIEKRYTLLNTFFFHRLIIVLYYGFFAVVQKAAK